MSEYLLALDTTTEFGGIALFRSGELMDETPVHAPGGFGHVLFGHMERLLDRHGLAAMEIGCFAAASGPGSFTGVRVGLACVKGLAEAAGAPVVPVSNLRAVASYGTAPLRAALLDARRGEVYGGLYDSGGNLRQEETVGKFARWLEGLPDGVEIVTPEPSLFAPMLGLRKITPAPRCLAAAVGRIAWLEWKKGQALDPAAVDANYVRRSDAELFWKEA